MFCLQENDFAAEAFHKTHPKSIDVATRTSEMSGMRAAFAHIANARSPLPKKAHANEDPFAPSPVELRKMQEDASKLAASSTSGNEREAEIRDKEQDEDDYTHSKEEASLTDKIADDVSARDDGDRARRHPGDADGHRHRGGELGARGVPAAQ